MTRWKAIVSTLLVSIILIMIGNGRNEVLEIHHSGAAMCLACIGLE